MPPISPPDLASAATGFATILSGVIALALTLLMGRQPLRWMGVYVSIIITGIPTVGYHGLAEDFWWGLADIGTNLLVVWATVTAVLWDYYPTRSRYTVSTISGLTILTFISWKVIVGPASSRIFPISLGEFGGFNVGEVLVIIHSLLVFGLLYARLDQIPAKARPLLYLFNAIFLVAAYFASASNQHVEYRLVAYHAIWHIISAFGFIVLWAFNHVRFVDSRS